MLSVERPLHPISYEYRMGCAHTILSKQLEETVQRRSSQMGNYDH